MERHHQVLTKETWTASVQEKIKAVLPSYTLYLATSSDFICLYFGILQCNSFLFVFCFFLVLLYFQYYNIQIII